MVRTVHDGAACMQPCDNWPYMQAPQQQRAVDPPIADAQVRPESSGAYTKLVKSVMLPITTLGLPKHVFKVRETTKLLLFASVAIGGVLALDLAARLIVSVSELKRR